MKGVMLRQLKLKSLFTDGGSRGMATGADIMCGSTHTDPPNKSAPHDENNSIQAAESSSFSITSAAIAPPAVEVDGELSKAQKWWRPDPATGTWLPGGNEAQLTTSADATKSASRSSARGGSETAASMEDKRSWWMSMEELPDMDRAK